MSGPATIGAVHPYSNEPERPPIEQSMDDMRQVLVSDASGRYVVVQRKWAVQDGPARHVMMEAPPEGRPWLKVPAQPLLWIPIRHEWRNLPIVTEADVAAERLAAGEKPISTT